MDINLQNLGKIPVISTFTGLARLVRGILRLSSKTWEITVENDIDARYPYIKKQRITPVPILKHVKNNCEYLFEKSMKERSRFEKDNALVDKNSNVHKINGLKDITRGLFEMIPIIGNLCVAFLDWRRDTNTLNYPVE